MMKKSHNTDDRTSRIYHIEIPLADKLRNAQQADRHTLYRSVYNEYAAALQRENLTPTFTGDNRTGSTVKKDAYVKSVLATCRKIVEIGCGRGESLRYLYDGHKELVGIDVGDAVMANKGAGITFKQGDAIAIDLPEASFDAAFSIDCIEHLHAEDLQLHLHSVHRLLRTGGIYIIMTPHRFVGPHDISVIYDRSPRGFHLQEYSYSQLAAQMCAAGFRHLRTSPLPFTFHAGSPMLRRINQIPFHYKIALEIVLGATPFFNIRRILFKLAGLYTVCLIGRAG
jgi:SAM-dependent methyltransferase